MKYLIAFFVFLRVLTNTTQGFSKISIDTLLRTPIIINDLSKDLSSNNDNTYKSKREILNEQKRSDQFEDLLRDIKSLIPFKDHQEIPIEKSLYQLSNDGFQRSLPDIISRLPRSIIDNIQQTIQNEFSKCLQIRSNMSEISINDEIGNDLTGDMKNKIIDLSENQTEVLNDIDIQANCMSTLQNYIQQLKQLLKDIEFIIPFPSEITDVADKLQKCTHIPNIEKHPFLYKGKVYLPKGSECNSTCDDLSLSDINILSCRVLSDDNDIKIDINEDTKVNNLSSEKISHVNINLENILPDIDFENIKQILTTLQPDVKREIDSDVKINSGLDVNVNSTEADADLEIRVRVNKSPRDGDVNANGCSKGNANEDGKVDHGDNSGDARSVDRNAKRSIDDSNNGANEKTGANVGEVTTKSPGDADRVGGMNIGGLGFEINKSKEKGENMFGLKLKLPKLPFLGKDDQDKINGEKKDEEKQDQSSLK